MCVCFRPYQHGGDMLAAIKFTLAQCTRADMATPAALALQGLQELCRAEVTLFFIQPTNISLHGEHRQSLTRFVFVGSGHHLHVEESQS